MSYGVVRFRQDRDAAWQKYKPYLKKGWASPMRAALKSSNQLSKGKKPADVAKAAAKPAKQSQNELVTWLKMFGYGFWFLLKLGFFKIRLILNK